jgi:plastocyanin
VIALAVLLALVLGVAARPSAYEVAPVMNGGTLTGVVRFVGKLPRAEPSAAVARDRDACGEPGPSEALVLGPGRTVKDSVILVAGVARGKAPGGDVVVDSRRCVFVSHVSTTMPGERVRVKNSDPLLHSARGTAGGSTVFHLALPHKDETIDITRRLTAPGVVRVVCDAHPHMAAWIVVHDSPYVAVTDERGTFTIEGIPPGTYTVTMWHEGFRARGVDGEGRPAYGQARRVTKDVTIGPKALASVDFELR